MTSATQNIVNNIENDGALSISMRMQLGIIDGAGYYTLGLVIKCMEEV